MPLASKGARCVQADRVLVERAAAVLGVGVDVRFVVVHHHADAARPGDRPLEGPRLDHLDHLPPRRHHRPALLLRGVAIAGDVGPVGPDLDIHIMSPSLAVACRHGPVRRSVSPVSGQQKSTVHLRIVLSYLVLEAQNSSFRRSTSKPISCRSTPAASSSHWRISSIS